MNDIDKSVFRALKYFYNITEVNALLQVQRSIICCFAICGRCGIRQKTFQLVVCSDLSLKTSCEVFQDDRKVTQCINKVQYFFDLDMASEAYIETLWEIYEKTILIAKKSFWSRYWYGLVKRKMFSKFQLNWNVTCRSQILFQCLPQMMVTKPLKIKMKRLCGCLCLTKNRECSMSKSVNNGDWLTLHTSNYAT